MALRGMASGSTYRHRPDSSACIDTHTAGTNEILSHLTFGFLFRESGGFMQEVDQDVQIKKVLTQARPLPEDPQKERVVLWKVFRDEAEALEYSHHILLEPDQKIVGGHGTDSVGAFFWLGIEVADLEAWGNTQAIQLTDPFDSTDPKGQGRGPGTD